MVSSKGQGRVIGNPEIVSEPTNRSHKGMVIRGWIPALVGAERHSLGVFIPTFSLNSWFAKLGSQRLSLKNTEICSLVVGRFGGTLPRQSL